MIRFSFLFLLLLFFSSCDFYDDQAKKKFIAPETKDLLKLSHESGIELFAIELLSNYSEVKPKHLRTSMNTVVLVGDSEYDYKSFNENLPNVKTVLIPGVFITLSKGQNALEIIRQIRPKIQKKKYEILVSERNYSMDNDQLAIIKSFNKFDPIKYLGTHGVNYDIDNDSVISILKYLDKKLDLEYIGADNDWCQFEITATGVDWHSLAEECYKFCPDIVDQGSGSISRLKEELQSSKSLYLWWD